MEIGYDAITAGRDYDPLLHWSAPWRDVYTYQGDRLDGWIRHHNDGTSGQRFDADGRPKGGQDVGYDLRQTNDGHMVLSTTHADADR